MSNVCVIRHQGYTKSKTQFSYRHNHRIGNNHSNQNIVSSLTENNTVLLNNLKDNETYLAAFKRLYSDNEFHGQLKVNGKEAKQTKFLDEFLVYPPYEKITAMSIEEQNEFLKKELDALQSYFPEMILLSAVIHRDEVFHPKDEEMKSMFPDGKVTAHMQVVAIPTVLDKKKGGKKISISELWKGKDSYRKLDLKTIMIALIRNAIDQEIIVENPMNGICIKCKFRAIHKQNNGTKVYLNDEYDKLDDHLEKANTIEALCIQMMFQLGVRIGEVVALKFSDVDYGKIAIQRMEENVVLADGDTFKSAGTKILEHLKKENESEYRFIPLTDKALEIIVKAKELNPNDEFIFVRDGERLTKRIVTYWLSKYCKEAGITYKSPHCTRRTTASRLHTAGMPLDMIRDILGQVDEKTILGYIYNPNTEEEDREIMNNALTKK